MNFKGRKAKIKSMKVAKKNGDDRLFVEVEVRMDQPEEGDYDPLRQWFAENVLTRPQLFEPVFFEGLDTLKREDMTPDQLERLATLERRQMEPIKLEQAAPKGWRERVTLQLWREHPADRISEEDAAPGDSPSMPAIHFRSGKCEPKIKIESWGARAVVLFKFSCATQLVNDDLNVTVMGELLTLPVFLDLTADPLQTAFVFDDEAMKAARAFRDSIPDGTSVTVSTSGERSVTLHGRRKATDGDVH